MTRHRSAPDRLRKYRPDIQGLRAVAIMMVVAMHCGILDIHGGVDISFVLSGFLIGSQLLAEIDRTGRVSLAKFWARRFRRLGPAMATVIVATAVLAWLYASPLRFRDQMKDGLSAALSFMNWRLVETGTDYFANDGNQSPYQHFWSLGIEEQFYLAAPLLLVGVAWLNRRVLVGAFLLAVIGASFYAGYTLTGENQPEAYFSTHTRIWELAFGVLVALWAPALSRMPQSLATVLTWLGLAGAIGSALLITETTPLPGYAVAGPVLGAGLVIAGGCANPRLGAERLLDNPVFDFIGNVSYGWYLWHWPLLILWPNIIGWEFTGSDRYRVAVLSFLLAVATHYVVERPFRSNTSLVARPWKGILAGGSATAGAAAVSAIALVVPLNLATGAGGSTVAVGYTNQASVVDSLAHTKLSAAVRSALPDAPDNHATLGCIDNTRVSEFVMRDHCAIGDPQGTKTLVLLGDSHAWQWNDAFDQLGKRLRTKVVTMAKGGCSPQAYRIVNPELNREYTECDTWRASAFAALTKLRPDVIVVANRTRQEATRAGAEESFAALQKTGAQLIYLTDTPQPGQNVPDCLATHTDDISSCNREQYKALEFAGFRTMEREVAQRHGAKIIDVVPAFCAKEICPSVIGGQIVYFDSSHITSTYSKTLTPYLEPALRQVLSS
ncbi:acyltransferase family protein [Streptomyces sp. S6]